MHRPLIIAALLFASSVVYGQGGQHASASDHRRVVNEDRGAAYVIDADTQPPVSPIKGKDDLPDQFSIFLGNGWNSDDLRVLEPRLANLFASTFGMSSQIADAIKNRTTSAPCRFIEVTFGNRDGFLTDLDIQEQVKAAVNNDSQPSLAKGTIIVVYVDPSLHSRLADQESGKHYAAYDNTVNVSGARIRYVVVPMEVNRDSAQRVAQTAFLWAIVDP